MTLAQALALAVAAGGLGLLFGACWRRRSGRRAAGEIERRSSMRVAGDAAGAQELAGGDGAAQKLTSLGDMAAGIAHEVNNPVATMVAEAGWIEDLLAEPEFAGLENTAELLRAARQIQAQGARCREITHNLLSFGRRATTKIQPLRLNDLVAEVVRTASRRAAGAAPAVRVRLAADLPDITAAPADLQQLIGNLVNNAVDAVEGRDGAAVEVATAREDEGLVLTVKDNGHGIPPEILERIFDPFFTTKPVGKGTGLGLSICYGIVSKMGGEISVDSAVGEGTTFQVTLPLAPPGAAAQAPAPDAAEGAVEGELEAAPHGPTHVLLVDDELELVDALSRRLVRRGVTVYAATDPEAALAILDAHPIDVAILDVRLRGASGLDLLREIKRRQPEVEAILLSGNQTIATAIEGIKLGASDYLLKPCDIPDLLGRIGRAKARKTAREQQSIEARVRDIAMRRE